MARFEEGGIAAEQANEAEFALVHAHQHAPSFSATLVELSAAEETYGAEATAAAHGLALLANGPSVPLVDALQGLNERFLRRHKVAYLGGQDDRSVFALVEPRDDVVAALHFACRTAVEPVIATLAQIDEFLGENTTEFEAIALGGNDEFDQTLDGESEAPIIRLVQSLLANAALRRASDVHIEPMAQHLIVRYRIDGRLIEIGHYPSGLARAVASRIKVLASLDIAETRLPQDGRLRVNVRGRDVDVRVSTSPTAFGESVVLRLLGRSELPLDLEQLGLPAAALQKILRALDRPHGIILLTGPTGSGKTTTLYAALSRLRCPEVKILTVEDPVEVLLEGVNQVQVRPEIGLSYAQTLRAFLRQDPDILMIGEIRDKETAEIALRAALTGHLVLSTLHTNSTNGAFTRLADIGIEPYLSASTVNAVIAQRLVRTLCDACSKARVPTSDEAALFVRNELGTPEAVHDAVGCSSCQGTGYRGRIPLIEVLEVDSGLRDAIRDGSIERLANPSPVGETLLGHGLGLIGMGKTTFAEVQRAVQTE